MDGQRRKLLLGAFGDPGHAFPMIGLGESLARRGHEVRVETWAKWREPVEEAGMGFLPAPSGPVCPTPGRPFDPYAAAAEAALVTREAVREWRPDGCVADVLTLGPALAAEAEGVPWATLVPHVFPVAADGAPPFGLGAGPPRTRAGERLWRAADRLVAPALTLGRRQLDSARARLGLPALPFLHGGLSRELTLVATLPQLEYPRDWPTWARVVGPLLWEPPGRAPGPVAPDGTEPLLLVAPSTSQDPGGELLRAALAGLAGAPVRVVAVDARRGGGPLQVPGNTRVVAWLSYAAAMPDADLVICHGGHGTLARALVSGCAVVVCPAGGDMVENAARVEWAGVGVRLARRRTSPARMRTAVERALHDGRVRRGAARIAAWADGQAPAERAADEVERWLERRPAGRSRS